MKRGAIEAVQVLGSQNGNRAMIRPPKVDKLACFASNGKVLAITKRLHTFKSY